MIKYHDTANKSIVLLTQKITKMKHSPELTGNNYAILTAEDQQKKNPDQDNSNSKKISLTWNTLIWIQST